MAIQPPKDGGAVVREMLARSKAVDPDSVADRQRVAQAGAIDRRSSFSRGLEAGVGGMAEAYHGMGAIFSAITGDEQGMQESAQKAQEYSNLNSRVAPEISDIRQIDGPVSAGRWAAGALGQVAPSLAAIMTGGGAGAVLAKQIGHRLIKRQIKNMGRKGMSVGAVGTGMQLEQGQLGAEMLQEDFDSDMTPRERAGLALAGGTVSGGLEALPIINLFNRYGLGKQLRKSIGREFATQAVQESATETGQQLIQRATLAVADQNREVLGEEGYWELANAAAMGAIGGGVLGGGIQAGIQGAQRGLEAAANRVDQREDQYERLPPPEANPLQPSIEQGLPTIDVEELTPEQLQLNDVMDQTRAFIQDMELDPEDPGYNQAYDYDDTVQPERDVADTAVDDAVERIRQAKYGNRSNMPGGVAGDFSQIPVTDPTTWPTSPQGPLDTELVLGPNNSPYAINSQTRETARKGTKTIEDRVDALNAQAREDSRSQLEPGYEPDGFDALGDLRIRPYTIRNYGDIAMDMARRERPGDPQGQQAFVAEMASRASNTRRKPEDKIQPGQDAVEYLNQFQAIEGPAQQNEKLSEDLSLTEEEATTYEGGVGRLANPKAAGKEKKRRQVIRDMNEETFGGLLNDSQRNQVNRAWNILNRIQNKSGNIPAPAAGALSRLLSNVPGKKYSRADLVGKKVSTVEAILQNRLDPELRAKKHGLNEGADLELPDGRALNAVALTIKMQSKSNQQQPVDSERQMAQRVGDWFLQGVASLKLEGIDIDLDSIPDDQVLYRKDGKVYTWKQAQKAVRNPHRKTTGDFDPAELDKPGVVETGDTLQRPIRRGRRGIENEVVMEERTDILKSEDEKRSQRGLQKYQGHAAADALNLLAQAESTGETDAYGRIPKRKADAIRSAMGRAGIKLDVNLRNGDLFDNDFKPRQGLRSVAAARSELKARLKQKAGALSRARHAPPRGDTLAASEPSTQTPAPPVGGKGGRSLEGKKAPVARDANPAVKPKKSQGGRSKTFLDSLKQIEEGTGAKILRNRDIKFSAGQTKTTVGTERSPQPSGQETQPLGQTIQPGEQRATTKKTARVGLSLRGQKARVDENATEDTGGQADKVPREIYDQVYAQAYNHRHTSMLDSFLRSMTARMGIKKPVKILTPEEMAAAMDHDSVREAKILAKRTVGLKVPLNSRGKPATKTNEIAAYGIFINPLLNLSQEQAVTVASHEFGHVVQDEILRNMDMNDPTMLAIDQAYRQWYTEHYGSNTTVEALKKTKVPFFLHDRVLVSPDQKTVADLTPEFRDYFFRFDEWFADQTARHLTTSKQGQSLISKFFEKVAARIKKLFTFFKKEGLVADPNVAAFYNRTMFREMTEPSGTTSDYIFEAIRRNAPALSEEDVQKLSRAVRAAFRTEDKKKYTEAEIAGYAVQIAEAAATTDSLHFANLRLAFEKFLNLKERKAVMRAFGTRQMINRVAALLKQEGNDFGAKLINNDPLAAIAYGYHYWSRDMLDLGPQTTTMYQRLAKRLRNVLGIVADSKNAEQVFTAIRDNNALIRAELGGSSTTFTGPRQLTNNMIQKVTFNTRALMEAVKPVYDTVFRSAYSRMASAKNPYMLQIARKVFVPTGSQGVEQGMIEAKHTQTARFHRAVARLVRGRDAEFKKKFVEAMNAGQWSKDRDVRLAQEKMAQFTRMMRKYLQDAGVDVGDRADPDGPGYWPWVFNTEMLLDPATRREFEAMLVRTMDDDFPNKHVGMKNRKRTLVDNEKKGNRTKEEAANAVTESIINSLGYGESPLLSNYDGAGHTPYMGSFDARILNFISKDPSYSKYLSTDFDSTMIAYVDQATKRAEFARRFKDDSSGLVELMDKAREAGMTVQEQELTSKYIQATMGTLGGDIDPRLRKGMGYMMVYENLRLLSMATFTSLVDPIGILVRTGSIQDAVQAARTGAREIATYIKRHSDDPSTGMHRDRALAETLGIIEDSIGKEALGYEYGGVYMTGMAKQMNEKWFELIGISGLTRMTRVMATSAGQNFLKRHSRSDSADSKRYLAELGVKAEDIKLDRKGNIKILSERARRNATEAELDRDDRVRNAMFRFVDEAILRPDAAQRPVYGSDPHFMLIFHLKGFMYSFYERIMKRAWNEATEHGNYGPMAGLGMYIPGMIFADMLRDAVKDAFGDQDDDRKDEWTLSDWMGHATERAGLFGPFLQQINDSLESPEFGKPIGLSMAGPSIEHLYGVLAGQEDALDFIPGQNLIQPLGDSLLGNFE